MRDLKYNPNMLIIDSTIRCNQTCYFCWRATPGLVSKQTKKTNNRNMPIGIYKQIVDDAAQYSHIKMLAIGAGLGDVFLLKDLGERAEYALGKFSVTVNTNGALVHRHDVDTLLNTLNRIFFSVDSVREDTYEKIHGNRKDLNTVISNIESIYERKKQIGSKCDIAVRFTEGEHNKGQFKEFSQFFKNKCDYTSYKTEYSFLNIWSKYFSTQGAKLCNQPYGVVNFNINGELTTCCVNWQLEPTFGSIENHSILELWEGEEMENWRSTRMSGICKDCSGQGLSSRSAGNLVA